MDTTRIYLIRHGQVVGHDEFRYNGHSDVDITELGRMQMENLAVFLLGKPIKAVYSSDLKRAMLGAGIISERLSIKPGRLPALRELCLGRWEGLKREEAVARYPQDARFSFKDLAKNKLPGGESLMDLRERVLPAVDKIIEKHRGEEVAIVAHGGVNRVILCEAMGLKIENFFRIEQDYGCLNIIDYFHDGVTVVKLLNGGPNQEMDATNIY